MSTNGKNTRKTTQNIDYRKIAYISYDLEEITRDMNEGLSLKTTIDNCSIISQRALSVA